MNLRSPCTPALPSLSHWMDEFISGTASPMVSRPSLRVWEDESAYTVEADLPGLTAEDVEISFHERQIVLEGGRTAKAPEGSRVHLFESAEGRFRRVLRFASEVDAEAATATLENGVLRVSLPKTAAARRRRIEVKVS